eukprot:TRINITY_DN3180_c0_g1_i1.p1 TRINITY_DN3180_c0_g1~~TRINITY_DN3180_c0_g1_i1.p1  ORF type:complete len:328 (-),score=60.25 TRINITY_DN3180_c0_g1_i1:42-1025(-)
MNIFKSSVLLSKGHSSILRSGPIRNNIAPSRTRTASFATSNPTPSPEAPKMTKGDEQTQKTSGSSGPSYSGGFLFNEYWRWIGFGASLPIVGYFFYHSINRPQETKTSASHNKLPGSSESLTKRALETGGDMLQRFDPVKSVHMHLCGFHFYSGDMKRAVEAHHYCNHLNEDFAQCIIYDSDKPDAKLIGIEYIISEKLFKTLSPEEQALWHSHVYEVKSGALVAPRLPEVAETTVLKHVINTYGKTVHTWQIDRDALPLGAPQLMMAFTKDGQLNAKPVQIRDNYYAIKSSDKKAARASMEAEPIHPNADAWEKGKVVQYKAVDLK